MNEQELNQDASRRLAAAWNARDVETVVLGHQPDLVLRASGCPPIVGRDELRNWCQDLLLTFPDGHIEGDRPKVSFAGGGWTCTILRCAGTMTGPLRSRGGEMAPTGRRFDLDVCIVSRWDAGQIAETNIFYDVATFMRQLGLQP